MSDLDAVDLVRPGDQRDLGLAQSDDEQTVLQQLAAHPQMLQRPIVVGNRRACLGRPPENVLEIL